jgi:ribosomal-protein-serine acetyltransferase
VNDTRDFAIAGRRRLRVLSEQDGDDLHALIERNRGELGRWMSWAEQTRAQTLDFVRRALASEADNGALQRAIVADRRIVGIVGLPAIDWANRSSEIGYWLDERERGKGTMTAAVAALAGHAFAALALNRLEIRTDIANARSRAVAERLGFQYEGTLRQSYRVSDERYSDDAVYSLLASDAARHALVARTSAP